MADGRKITLSKGQKALFYGGSAIATVAFVGPVLAFAAAGAVSLVKIASCVGVLFMGWMLIPWFKIKWKNVVLKLIKAEARANPIETLENEYIARSKNLELARERLTSIISMRNSLSDKLDVFKKRHGVSDEGMEKMLLKSTQLIERLKRAEGRGAAGLEDFKLKLEMRRDRYNMALSTGELARAIKNATGNNDPLQEFVTDEALDAVRSEFNHSMAEINRLLEGDEVVKQLSDDRNIDGVIDVTPIETPELETVR